MPFPAGTYLSELFGRIRDEFENLYAQFEGYLRKEHKADGSHSAIHADSIETTGDGDFGGDITADSITLAGGAGIETTGVVVDSGGKVNVASAGNAVSPDIRIGTFNHGIGYRVDGGGTSPAGTLLWADAGDPGRVMLQTDTFCPVRRNGGSQATKLGSADHLWHGVYSDSVGYFERSRAAAIGEWTNVTYAAGNFTADVGNWTVDSGDQVTYAYMVVGKTMWVAFVITTTDVSSTPSVLRIAIPGGFTAARDTRFPIFVQDNGAAQIVSMGRVVAAGTQILLYPTPAAATNWATTAADNTTVLGTAMFEIQ